MKKSMKYLVVIALVTLNSCASNIKRNVYDLSYNMNLEVSKDKNQKQVAELKRKITISGDERTLKYQDDFISTEWAPEREGFWFSIRNKSANKIKLIWKDAFFSDGESGTFSIKKYNLDKYEKEAVILPDSFYEDYIYPYKNPNYSYFPVKIVTKSKNKSKIVYDTLEDLYDKFVNKPVQVFVPIEIDGIIHEYRFIFNINEINLSDD